MITTPLKIGLAAACLVVVAVLIAVDQSRLRKDESLAPAPAIDIPQAVLQPPLTLLPAPKAEDATICPATPKPEEKKAETPAPVVEKPAAPVKKILIDTLPSGTRLYTVVQGDTLYGISVKVYNTPRHYERIYDANKEKIDDPNTLQIGMKLVLPDAAAKAVSGSTNQ